MKELVEGLKTDSTIIMNSKWTEIIKKTYRSAKAVAQACLERELHIPCMLEALNFFHGIKTANLSANLIQAQRDYFGAHTYERSDNPGVKVYTIW